MRRFFTASLLLLAVVATSAFSGDSPAPNESADLEERMTILTAKLEAMERRFDALEAENKELRADLSQLRVQFICAPPIHILDIPGLHLVPPEDLSSLFILERPIVIGGSYRQEVPLELGDTYQPDHRLDLIAPPPNPEFKVDLDIIILPQQK